MGDAGRMAEPLGEIRIRRAQAGDAAAIREAGHSRVRLFTNGRWTANVRLYQRLGYAIDGETPIDGAMVRVDMSRRLA
ncbi:hypothetical protein ACO2Q3_26280 [Caulobacter sp. KR2-114]|uniref:hypothetical protein n=1 Tax=Caulobacter sp. KR2-114 TaxID=3400912 RepID=UPI003C0B6155